MASTDYRVGGKVRNGRVIFYLRLAGRIIATGFRSRKAAEVYAVRHFRNRNKGLFLRAKKFRRKKFRRRSKRPVKPRAHHKRHKRRR